MSGVCGRGWIARSARVRMRYLGIRLVKCIEEQIWIACDIARVQCGMYGTVEISFYEICMAV